MLIQVLGFGTNWWARFGHHPGDRYRFTRRTAYFNSTGLRCGGKLRRYWLVPGLLRFIGNGFFDPDYPNRNIGKIFECDGPSSSFAHSQNRLLFVRRVPEREEPDYYLLVVSSEQHGWIDFADAQWKSDSVVAFAVSCFRNTSEAMLLMKMDDCLKSSLGNWRLQRIERTPTLILSE